MKRREFLKSPLMLLGLMLPKIDLIASTKHYNEHHPDKSYFDNSLIKPKIEGVQTKKHPDPFAKFRTIPTEFNEEGMTMIFTPITHAVTHVEIYYYGTEPVYTFYYENDLFTFQNHYEYAIKFIKEFYYGF